MGTGGGPIDHNSSTCQRCVAGLCRSHSVTPALEVPALVRPDVLDEVIPGRDEIQIRCSACRNLQKPEL